MANPSKRKGSDWEVALRDYALDNGIDITRLSANGSRDMGDLAIRLGGKHYVVEAKAAKSLDLATWVTEAAVEADNYATLNRLDRALAVPIVVVKRRMAGVGKAYVVQELDWWLDDHR